ncbi:unnamed protein product [Trichogramma brassicae]|uniref:Oxysterol-binding protein n=1 Tax=Trichogramma brassicae TaxID=86971 RepID=A0A6H5IR88_9HYME|nr:unnamed protein product [Trichogramma brassicae]
MTTTTMEGSLSKWTNVVNGWQYRWFVLDDNAGLLSYYTSKEKMKRGARRGCVRLKGAVIGIDDEDDSTFTITTSSSKDDPKTFHFQKRRGARAMGQGTRGHDTATFPRACARIYRVCLALPDVIRISNSIANAMLNAVKHAIVQLQIAKNTAIPVNGIYRGPTEPAPVTPTLKHVDSMESHGSVVTHLLSQVKIGMDLTKVALPTFILERRSLLEMYADYFAHPDQFVSIADMTSPRERMVQVCKWYLCSFHAGRRSGVAKKPYNPVLGEIFRCFWELPGPSAAKESSSSGTASTQQQQQQQPAAAEVEDGPVPWCNENQLAFVAEQVSHHPPVSAFYAEHKAKRISFGAHVWTKSKFLGLSIGVHNVGKGTVRLHAHDEDYVLTFPNGYARSILTVPWIELGGATSIVCAQTGYQASVDFLTKPFYGGKKNRITCSVTGPQDKKPFLVINGDWNGAMEAKWADGRTEVFADVREQKVERKLVKPMSEQEDDESRKVWREVTMGLRINDMDKATAAKIAIEQKQRDDVRYRKDNNIAWHTKLFKETKDGGWDYISPLENRLSSDGSSSSVPASVDTGANTSANSST